MKSPSAVIFLAMAVSADALSFDALSLLARRKPDADPTIIGEWGWYDLDETEVTQRGSVCLDGSTPGFFHKPGTQDEKWIISFEGGSMFCTSEDDCHSMTKGSYVSTAGIMEMTIFNSDGFSDFHQIQLHHCDGGLWLGDRSEPLMHEGTKLYSRGKRIVDHTIEHLTKNTPFATATEVLITGGSGGGQAAYLMSDYLSSILPATVKKIGAAPMSGWFNANADSIEWVYKNHGMSGAIAPGCSAAFEETERHNCLEPKIAYQYSKVPMFVVQVLDSQGISGMYWDNSTYIQTAIDAWSDCIDEENRNCDSTSVHYLQNFMDNLTSTIKATSKYAKNGEGGFISTCKKHVFYKLEEYNKYEINGVSVADAVKRWWTSLDSSSSSQWYWPCELNKQGQAQCESSCSYDTCKLPEGKSSDAC